MIKSEMGLPKSWLVDCMENPIKIDDLGVSPFRKPPLKYYVYIYIII